MVVHTSVVELVAIESTVGCDFADTITGSLAGTRSVTASPGPLYSGALHGSAPPYK